MVTTCRFPVTTVCLCTFGYLRALRWITVHYAHTFYVTVAFSSPPAPLLFTTVDTRLFALAFAYAVAPLPFGYYGCCYICYGLVAVTVDLHYVTTGCIHAFAAFARTVTVWLRLHAPLPAFTRLFTRYLRFGLRTVTHATLRFALPLPVAGSPYAPLYAVHTRVVVLVHRAAFSLRFTLRTVAITRIRQFVLYGFLPVRLRLPFAVPGCHHIYLRFVHTFVPPLRGSLPFVWLVPVTRYTARLHTAGYAAHTVGSAFTLRVYTHAPRAHPVTHARTHSSHVYLPHLHG